MIFDTIIKVLNLWICHANNSDIESAFLLYRSTDQVLLICCAVLTYILADAKRDTKIAFRDGITTNFPIHCIVELLDCDVNSLHLAPFKLRSLTLSLPGFAQLSEEFLPLSLAVPVYRVISGTTTIAAPASSYLS
uniref:Uncharacterized protein n=1 Tax=Glossina pallidipes TaxID=7398 RepID=A0A1B0ACG7_GLOPL